MRNVLASNATRQERITRIENEPIWDAVVIGGGATGSGIAVDAAARGFKVLLIDAQDFSAGTSSRSTKLIHGGVRYLKNPRDWKLVREALKERKMLLDNAPHIVKAKPFIIPCYKDFEREYYMAGLCLYSGMSTGGYSIGKTEWLRTEDVIRRLPNVKAKGLKGGVQFWDGQFDDARLNVALVKTAEQQGAVALNYFACTGFEMDEDGQIKAVKAVDKTTGKEYSINTRMVFNAAGVWVDGIRKMLDPTAKTLVRVSKGSHIIVDAKHFEGTTGMLVPKTEDKRVVFCIPWHGVVEIGTTDIENQKATFEPQASDEEIDFMIRTVRDYMEFPIDKSCVKASFAGLRPLFDPQSGSSSAQLSREHTILTEFKNMVTVTGGKWTSYRKMAEDAMTEAVESGLIYKRPCPTAFLSIYRQGKFDPEQIEIDLVEGKDNDAAVLEYARYCREEEYAKTAQDFLFRRLRIGQMSDAITERLRPKVEELYK